METPQNSSTHNEQKTVRTNPVTRVLGWYWGKRDSANEKGEPFTRTLIALVLVVVGVLGSEFYQWARGEFVGPDEYLVKIKEEQDKSFKTLQDSLGALGRSVDASGRDALDQVNGAVSEIKSANTGLLAQLTLAKAENERLSRVGGSQAGAMGGYDLILSENTGMPLGPDAELGVQNILKYGANVALTAAGSDGKRQLLRSGESIAYQGSAGRSCNLTLLSIGGGESASFRNRCQ